jgi:uncharacterized membrane protein YkvA (DUF1232 family)
MAIVAVVALCYGESPIDAIPDPIPAAGLADDLAVAALAVGRILHVWLRKRPPAKSAE